jgi:hypothetical protein
MCIGLQKAGTGWLYDQLDGHPDFEMPPVKELHYFNRGLQPLPLKKLQRLLDQGLDEANNWRARRRRRLLSAADVDFLRRARAVRDGAGGIDDYAMLFGYEGLTGDITPAYSTLGAEEVQRIARRFPGMKVVLLLREPASRAASHLGMMADFGHFPPEALESVARVADWFAREQVQERSRPSVIWKRWSAAVPPEQIRYFFFEDLCDRPDWLRSEIVSFLGGDSTKPIPLPPAFNRKGPGRTRTPDAVRAYLAKELREEILACAELFGGHAANWARSALEPA